MSERENRNSKKSFADDENFEQLLEEYLDNENDQYRVGDRVEGRVSGLGEDVAFIEFGRRCEGILALSEFMNDDNTDALRTGSVISLWITSISDKGYLLSRGLRFSPSDAKRALRDAYQNGIPVEGVVKGVNKGGFDIDISGVSCFCPISKIDVHYCEEPSQMLGLTARFKIISIEPGSDRVVVSRREILEQESKEMAMKLKASLVPGGILEGRVSKIMRFGVLLEFRGVEGFVPLRELSHEYFEDPGEIVQLNQTVKAKFIEESRDDKGRDRLIFSLKATETDPWTQPLPFKEGDVIKGKVTRLEAYGAFIRLTSRFEGLLHISEISSERISHPSKSLKAGQDINVKIVQIDRANKRLSLSIKQAVSDEPSATEVDNVKVDGVETDGGSGRFGIMHKALNELKKKSAGDDGSDSRRKPGQ